MIARSLENLPATALKLTLIKMTQGISRAIAQPASQYSSVFRGTSSRTLHGLKTASGYLGISRGKSAGKVTEVGVRLLELLRSSSTPPEEEEREEFCKRGSAARDRSKFFPAGLFAQAARTRSKQIDKHSKKQVMRRLGNTVNGANRYHSSR